MCAAERSGPATHLFGYHVQFVVVSDVDYKELPLEQPQLVRELLQPVVLEQHHLQARAVRQLLRYSQEAVLAENELLQRSALADRLRQVLHLIPVRLERLELHELADGRRQRDELVARNIEFLELEEVPELVREVNDGVEAQVEEDHCAAHRPDDVVDLSPGSVRQLHPTVRVGLGNEVLELLHLRRRLRFPRARGGNTANAEAFACTPRARAGRGLRRGQGGGGSSVAGELNCPFHQASVVSITDTFPLFLQSVFTPPPSPQTPSLNKVRHQGKLTSGARLVLLRPFTAPVRETFAISLKRARARVTIRARTACPIFSYRPNRDNPNRDTQRGHRAPSANRKRLIQAPTLT